jgi:hypothetical protein
MKLVVRGEGSKIYRAWTGRQSIATSKRLFPASFGADHTAILQVKLNLFPADRQKDWDGNHSDCIDTIPDRGKLLGPNLILASGIGMGDACRLAPMVLQPARSIRDGIGLTHVGLGKAFYKSVL